MINDLKKLLENSEKILVTSHISPDPDAVASLLLMGLTLKDNFPKKNVKMVLEERPSGLEFIQGFDQVEFKPVYDAVKEFEPQLLILLDGNNYERFSRKDGQGLREYVEAGGVKTVVVDHHELAGKDEVNVFINNQSPAVAQDIYEICFKELGLKKPRGAEQIAMTGFYADTGGFVYIKEGQQKLIFDFAKELVDNGANVEEIKNDLEKYSEDDLRVLGELMNNLSHKDDYTYSFLSDDFINSWLKDGHSHLDLQRPTNMFLNSFIRNIDGRRWGFIVYKNTLEGDDYYSASFRSQGGNPDVSVIAGKLGGGGHKPAAGARFKASELVHALEEVQQAIVK